MADTLLSLKNNQSVVITGTDRNEMILYMVVRDIPYSTVV